MSGRPPRQHRPDLVAEITRALTDDRLTQSALATMAGISPATLSPSIRDAAFSVAAGRRVEEALLRRERTDAARDHLPRAAIERAKLLHLLQEALHIVQDGQA